MKIFSKILYLLFKIYRKNVDNNPKLQNTTDSSKLLKIHKNIKNVLLKPNEESRWNCFTFSSTTSRVLLNITIEEIKIPIKATNIYMFFSKLIAVNKSEYLSIGFSIILEEYFPKVLES